MAQQTINVGASPNDGTGTPLRTAFQYTNSNFSELYTAVGPSGNNIVVPGSATITGDLTVDTSTLKVDSANNRVGIVQATPLYPLHLVGEFGLEEASPAGTGSKLRFIGDATKYNFRIGKQLNVNNGFEITPSTALGGTTFSNPVYTVTYDGIHTFLDGAGGTRMTLNSTGLGVGQSPTANLDVQGNPSTGANNSVTGALTKMRDIYTRFRSNSAGISGDVYAAQLFGGGNAAFEIYSMASYPLVFGTAATERMRIDSTGNVGIGVTPSTWSSSYKALQFGQSASVSGFSSELAVFGSNCYFDTTDSRWERITSGFTSQYYQTGGTHVWRIGGTAGANTDCAFTQAMTLDASGVLLVGTTTAPNVGAATTSSGFSINGSGNNAYIASKIDNGTCGYFRRDGTDGAALNFYKANSAVGNISVTASACTFNSTSDYRLKESVQLLTGGLARVSALKPSIYKWKADGSNGEGFIAHELAEVVPAAVSGEKDALNEDGSIKPQGVDMSRVVPILVAAIQELTARVQTLEAK